MILTEIISSPSKDFFDGVPDNRHYLLMSYCESSEKLTSGYDSFVKVNSLELIKQKFIASGFQEFDASKLMQDFYEYCQHHRKESFRIMETGFLDDMKEFVYRFIQGQ